MTYDIWATAVMAIAIYTAIAVVMLRHYAPAIPRLTLMGYALLALLTGAAFAVAVAYGVPMPTGPALMPTRAILIFIAYSIAGVIISALLKRRGVSKPFPGIGARVMIVLFAVEFVPVLVMTLLSPQKSFPT